MKSINRKWWLALVALLYLAPATFAVQDGVRPKHHFVPRQNRPKQTVPEGGSSLVYVLGAGVTCLGAMLVRSRVANPKES
jgi:hypothetical protein